VSPSDKFDDFIKKPCSAKSLIVAIVKQMDIGIEAERESNNDLKNKINVQLLKTIYPNSSMVADEYLWSSR
jgi:FixJ family two-component response regulator